LQSKMGKKGEETSTPELALTTKMDLLKGKVALIEKVMQKQSLEFRYEMASSQAKLQVDIKDQLDDFLSSMMKFKSPTPPPHAKPPESIASHMGQETEYIFLVRKPLRTCTPIHPTLTCGQYPTPLFIRFNSTAHTKPLQYIPNHQHSSSSGQLNWPRNHITWPEPTYTNPYTPQHQTQPTYQNTTTHNEHHFAQSFSKGLKMEFSKFDGNNPRGWLRQAEKCFTLAQIPEFKKVKFAEVFFIGKPDHWLRSTCINTNTVLV
jgi:predicted component of type VI protein secretion system